MKARVHIFYKDSVFDPQGNAVQHSLNRMGFSKVQGVRIGKVVDIELSNSSGDEAKRDLTKMCDKLLANPVIESYKIELKDG